MNDMKIYSRTVVELKPRLLVLCVHFNTSYHGGQIHVCCLVALKGYFVL